MHISPEGIKLICKWEGYHKRLPDGRCTTYYCPANVLTIGYGCTHGIQQGEIWTHAEAVRGLRRELDDIERAVNRLVQVDLTQAQYDALVSFTYNCGAGALARSTLLRHLNAGKYHEAWKQLPRWRRGGGRVLRGLVRRRRDEQAHWMRDIPVYAPGELRHVPEPVRKPAPKKKRGADAEVAGDQAEKAPPVYVEDRAEHWEWIVDETPAEREDMAQSVDDPAAPEQELKGSRKWSLIQWLRGIFGFSAVGSASFLSAGALEETQGYVQTVNQFVQAYGIIGLVVFCIMGWVAAEMLRKWMRDDVEDGRYEPSGEEVI